MDSRKVLVAGDLPEAPLNKEVVLFHVSEAEEALRLLAEEIRCGNCDEDDLFTSLAHVYHHVNTAWNARDLSRAESDERFFELRRFARVFVKALEE